MNKYKNKCKGYSNLWFIVSLLVVFLIAGCSGSKGSTGATGPQGSQGTPGTPGSKSSSSSKSSAPSAPAGLRATAGNGQVSLTWSASTGATSYNVYQSTTSGGPYTQPYRQVGSSTSTSDTITGLTNGTTYYFVVTAVNSNGESGHSNEASATTQPITMLKQR